MDIVERLRKNCTCNFESTPCGAEEECQNAFDGANEIERLREALQKMEASRSEWSTGVGERVVYYAGKIKAQADEIERLRGALKDIENMPIVYESENIYKQIARAALQQNGSE